MSIGRSVVEILRLVEALHTSYAEAVSTPEGWRSKDPVIDAAPLSIEDAMSHEPTQNSPDWFFRTNAGLIEPMTIPSDLKPIIKGFYDPRTFSVQYVASCPKTRRCAIIDPVFDFDEKSGSTASRNADKILAYIEQKELTVEWILDTHPHADHFSAARYIKEKTQAPTCIGARVGEVQMLWKKIYNWPDFPTDGSQWDRLFADGETFMIGDIPVSVMFSPGHTLASISYVVGDAAFVHDTLFMPDSGTARCDFPGGNARTMWRSVQRILSLPGTTRLFTGHDYQPGGREPRWESTVGDQKLKNIHITGKDEESYVALREARDRTMEMPGLILHALQINVRGGRLPEPEGNGTRYLKIPLNTLQGAYWA